MRTGLQKATLTSSRKNVRATADMLRVAVSTGDVTRTVHGAMVLGTYVEKLCTSAYDVDQQVGEALYDALRTEGVEGIVTALTEADDLMRNFGNRYL